MINKFIAHNIVGNFIFLSNFHNQIKKLLNSLKNLLNCNYFLFNNFPTKIYN